jgi:hypothetical protein
VGKLADLAVLSRDYMTIPVREIGALESLLTMVGGRIVYGAGPYGRSIRPRRSRRTEGFDSGDLTVVRSPSSPSMVSRALHAPRGETNTGEHSS